MDDVWDKARDVALEVLMDMCMDTDTEIEERRWAAVAILEQLPSVARDGEPEEVPSAD